MPPKLAPNEMSLNKYSLEYSYNDLKKATKSFQESTKLGSGSYGSVYKGIQHDGTEVAVKVLEGVDSGFEEEVRVLSKFRHPNLVILMGFARHSTKRFLVYEFLGGGDVHRRLYSETKVLPFRHRIGIAYDAACGLSHLHNSNPKVFHRDIKPLNILLDRYGSAKMADFGLACLASTTSQQVAQASGTVGYACPWYAKRLVVTEGSEVYSFGIVLLELLTARAPAWVTKEAGGKQVYNFLTDHLQGQLRSVMDILDPKAMWPAAEAAMVAELALRCTDMREESRPGFAEIVNALRPMRDEPEVVQAVPMYWPNQQMQYMNYQQPMVMQVQQPPPQPAVGAPTVSAPPALPNKISKDLLVRNDGAQGGLLWTLTIIGVEGNDALQLPAEQRTIQHRQLGDSGLPSPLTVGRKNHQDVLSRLIPQLEILNLISREHFQIYAAPLQEHQAGSQVGECAFFCTNVSTTQWTGVNSVLLDWTGKTMQIHHMDVISIGHVRTTSESACAFVPFLQFRFDLTGSCLRDISSLPPALAMPEPQQGPLPSAIIDEQPSCMIKGHCLRGAVKPLFVLELHGTAVNEGLPPEARTILHGPPLRGQEENQDKEPGFISFPELIIGRYDTDFWKKALKEEVLAGLSRHHAAFDACSNADFPGCSGVAVRGLSAKRPIRVVEGCKLPEQSENIPPLELEERCGLVHNSSIIIATGRNSKLTLWLVFKDLRRASILPSGRALEPRSSTVGGSTAQ